MSYKISVTYLIIKPYYRDILKIVAMLLSVIVGTTLGSQYSFAEDIALQWDPSRSANIAGYKVYSRTVGGEYYNVENVGNVTTHVIRGLSRDNGYIFSVTAYDAYGTESIHSNEVRWGSRFAGNISPDADRRCLIEVAYGNPRSREVLLLRNVRDRYLAPHFPGRIIIFFYDWISPRLADVAGEGAVFRTMTRCALWPVIYVLSHPMRSALCFVILSAVSAVGIMHYRRRKRKVL